MVLGVRVHGDVVDNVDVTFDDRFHAVPVPAELGIPVMWKKMSGTGGDDSHIRNNVIVRFMSDPEEGFAPAEWQYGGSMGPAPPVVLARRDALPFSKPDWAVLDNYIAEWLEQSTEEEDDRAGVAKRYLNPEAFRRYVRQERESWPTAFLSLQFPLGSTVVSQGLASAELNGLEGSVLRYSRDRVGVQLLGREPVALKPERLTVVREPEPPPAKAEPAPEPPEQQQQRRRKRGAELRHAECRQIVRRFIECLHEDTFPEMGDLHLFGIGGDYRPRAQDALAVWQGAVKNGDVTEDSLTDALDRDEVKPYFEETCRKLATARVPNATYAQELIRCKFAALEFDTM